MARGLGEDEVRDFWEGVAQKRGGAAEHRSFGRYIGRSGDGMIAERTGLLYLAAGRIWFETVETKATLLGFALPDNGKFGRYEAFELGVDLGDLEGAACVSLRDAKACVMGKYKSANLKPLGLFGGLFDFRVLQLKLRDGSCHFFEASKDKEIAALVEGRRGGG